MRLSSLLPVTLLLATSAGAQSQPRPAPPATTFASTQTAVLAGGCFWGVEAVFEHTKGVVDVVSGYAGGDGASADYETVGSGRTRHAESVRVTYDPSQVSYEQLLRIFFSVVHDPTQLNRQGPDVGPQYRSAVFYSSPEQQSAARGFIDGLTRAGAFRRPIVTDLSPLKGFFAAEPYHQDFVANNPAHPYVVYHDLPKLSRLKAEFPALYRDR